MPAPPVTRAFIVVVQDDDGETSIRVITERANADPKITCPHCLIEMAKAMSGGDGEVIAVIETIPIDPEAMGADKFEQQLTISDEGIPLYQIPAMDA